MAVEAKLPVKGTSYTAADIAIVDPEAKNADGYAVGAMDCPWNKWLLHGLNYSHPGTKAYIASLAELYSDDWELDMLKIDCKQPRYRCHLGCILLKTAAISLSTGAINLETVSAAA